MNLQLGGGGGFSSEEHQKKASDAFVKRCKNDKKFAEELSIRMSNLSKRSHALGKLKSGKDICDWNGRTHNEETKRKIGEANSIKQKGSNNSQYGKCWITNETESKKIYKGDTIPEGWRLGRKIS